MSVSVLHILIGLALVFTLASSSMLRNSEMSCNVGGKMEIRNGSAFANMSILQILDSAGFPDIPVNKFFNLLDLIDDTTTHRTAYMETFFRGWRSTNCYDYGWDHEHWHNPKNFVCAEFRLCHEDMKAVAKFCLLRGEQGEAFPWDNGCCRHSSRDGSRLIEQCRCLTQGCNDKFKNVLDSCPTGDSIPAYP